MKMRMRRGHQCAEAKTKYKERHAHSIQTLARCEFPSNTHLSRGDSTESAHQLLSAARDISGRQVRHEPFPGSG